MNLYSLFQKHPLICTDSRNCPVGSIFFALKGDNFNANAFALSALEKGCAFAPRCKYATDKCHNERPELQATGTEGHMFACWNPLTSSRGDA